MNRSEKGAFVRSMPPDELAELAMSKLSYDADTGLFTWHNPGNPRFKGQIAGNLIKGKGYVYIGLGGAYFMAHRLAWVVTYKKWPSGEIDHINGIRHDNRLSNLRDVTRSENMCNQRTAQARNKAGLLGVCHNKNKDRWEARIGLNGKYKVIGLFRTPAEAHEAYLKAKREIHSTCTI